MAVHVLLSESPVKWKEIYGDDLPGDGIAFECVAKAHDG